MSEESDKEMFTYLWRIENFSMCPQKKGECIRSPDFVVDVLDNTTWYLELYPRGDSETNGDYLSCFLIRGNKKEEPKEVTILCAIEVACKHTKSYEGCMTKNAFKKSFGFGISKLEALNDVLENKKTILPYDALSILCAMRRPKASDKETKIVNITVPRVNYTCSVDTASIFVSNVNASSEHRIDNCIVNTRIPVESHQMKWVIKDFKTQMRTDKKISASIASSLREKSVLLLQCYLRGDWDSDGSVMIDIQRKDKEFKEMLLKCEVSVLDKNGVAKESREHQHRFGKDYEIWTLPPVIKLTTLHQRMSELMDGQNLTLQFMFMASYKAEENVVGETELKIIGTVDTINSQQDANALLKRLKFSDVTLICEGLELPVHKSVICTWSRVFEAMFTNDTEEKRTGVVRITDTEADTLRKLKDFMYGSHLPDLEPEEAVKLYSAADKYEVLPLKAQCAASLKCSLSVSNVCEILVLADLHNDTQLLKWIQDFLLKHSLDVFKSSEWMNLMETNLKLAGETMREILFTLAAS